jgi:deoxyribonuclease V
MDFRGDLRALLDQIPPGRVARCGDVARALGDVRASAAIFRFLSEHPDIPGAHRILTDRARTTSPQALRRLREEGWDPSTPPFAAFEGEPPLRRLRREQLRIAAKVTRRAGFRTVRTVGGVDVSYAGDRGFAALVVLRGKDLTVVEEVLVSQTVDFPYIPTYLAYRELPLIEAAFRRLSAPPTVLLVDGHGQLHPARCGIACMVGVKLGVPTIGVAKNPLVGTTDRRPTIGEAVPVRYEGEVLGYAVRTGASIRPLYVSTGHRVAPRTAVRIVRELCRTRNPEPLRLADSHAKVWKEGKGKRF